MHGSPWLGDGSGLEKTFLTVHEPAVISAGSFAKVRLFSIPLTTEGRATKNYEDSLSGIPKEVGLLVAAIEASVFLSTAKIGMKCAQTYFS